MHIWILQQVFRFDYVKYCLGILIFTTAQKFLEGADEFSHQYFKSEETWCKVLETLCVLLHYICIYENVSELLLLFSWEILCQTELDPRIKCIILFIFFIFTSSFLQHFNHKNCLCFFWGGLKIQPEKDKRIWKWICRITSKSQTHK